MKKVAFVLSGTPKNLKYLKNNRSLIEKALRQQGWEIVNSQLNDISNFNKLLSEYPKNTIDEFIFFFTGHGDVSNQQEILKLELDYSKININEIQDSIFEYINPKKLAIILDSCYSGTLKGLNLNKNIEFLFSSQAKEQSFEDHELQHSIFTYYFAEALNTLNHTYTLKNIHQYINSKTNKQEPLSVNIGNNGIEFHNLHNNETFIENPKNHLTVHPLYLIILFLSSLFFIKEYYFTDNSDTNTINPFTKVLLEERTQDKVNLEKAKQQKTIKEKQYQFLRETILKELDRDKALKILQKADNLYVSHGLDYSINFLTIAKKVLIQSDNIPNTDINIAHPKPKELNITHYTQNDTHDEDTIYQVELYENSRNTLEPCDIYHDKYHSILTVTCNSSIDELKINYEIAPETLAIIAQNSTNFSSVKNALAEYQKFKKHLTLVSYFARYDTISSLYDISKSKNSYTFETKVYHSIRENVLKQKFINSPYQKIYIELFHSSFTEQVTQISKCKEINSLFLKSANSIISEDLNQTKIKETLNNLASIDTHNCPFILEDDLKKSLHLLQNLNDKEYLDLLYKEIILYEYNDPKNIFIFDDIWRDIKVK